MRQAARLDGIGSTIFAEMSALAVRTQAINLGQGFPDEDGPSSVVEVAVEAMRAGRNQYPPGHGTPEMVAAVIEHQRACYGLELEPAQVVVTTGATEAIAGAMLGLVDPGDEVVVLEPYYDSYVAMIQIAGGVRRPVTLRAPDFRLDLDSMEAAIGERTKLILLNTPHNPTGTVLTRAELEGVARLAIEHDLVVVTDEVYEHLVFDGSEHVPIATLPGMAERTLSISSSGKTFSFTGWKIGWATGPAELVAAVEGAKNWLSFASGAPLQPAIAHALTHELALPPRPPGRPPGQARPAVRGAGQARRRRPGPGGDVLRHHGRAPPGMARRTRVLPRPSGAGRGGGDPEPGLLRRPGGGTAPRALGVLQVRGRDPRGPGPAGRRRSGRWLAACVRGPPGAELERGRGGAGGGGEFPRDRGFRPPPNAS